MANRKLSEHTAITGANVNPNADYIEILDVSDTTDAASGTNKKILPSQLLIAIGAEPAKGADDNYVTDAEKAKLGNITVTQAVDLDSIETLANGAIQSGGTAGGELSGTWPNPTILNSAVLAKVLTGLNVTGSSLAATDTIIEAFGKVQSQLNGVLGGAIYQGVWNATTNSPSLASATGTKGYYYVVSVAGSINLDGVTDWKVGDWAIYNGTAWQKVDNTDAVSSVNGFTGAVSLTSANISEVTNLYFTTARVLATALTGFSAGAGTVAATDTILQAINKIVGNIAGKQNTLGNGDVTLAMINATGTPGAGNYLRGDGTWSAVPGGGSSIEILTATIGTTQNDYAIIGISNYKNVLSVLRITPSASFKITGISATGLDDGKRVRIYNNSDPLTAGSMIILAERNSTSSLSANRLLSPIYGSFPPIITPGQYLDFELNTTVGSWTLVSASDWGNPNGFFDTYSDCHVNAPFLTNTATAGSVGATSSNTLSNTVQKTVGTMLHTITTNGGRSYLGTQNGAMYLGSGSALGMARVFFGALADATNDYFSCNLFTNAGGGSSPVDQCGFVYNRSVSTDWRTSTVSNSTETANTVAGFTPSITVAHTIGVFINGDGTRVDFFYSVDGDTWNFATSHTTNIPSGTSRVLGFSTGFTKTAGSGSKTMITDWLGFKLMTKRGV